MSDRPEDDQEFMRFWQTYGRVGPRKVAWQCWLKAVRKAAPADIIAGLERWVTYWQQPGASAVKWPQGWLNEERWNDDPPTFLCRLQRPATALDHAVGRAQQARGLNGSATPIPSGIQRAIAAAASPGERNEVPPSDQGRLL